MCFMLYNQTVKINIHNNNVYWTMSVLIFQLNVRLANENERQRNVKLELLISSRNTNFFNFYLNKFSKPLMSHFSRVTITCIDNRQI